MILTLPPGIIQVKLPSLMTEKKLLYQVRVIAVCEGAYRGVYQVPLHLALVLALMKQGISWNLAFATVVVWINAIPQFFNFGLELAGGMIAQRLSTLGSFLSLAIGFALRTFAVVVLAAAYLAPTKMAILALGAVGLLISEAGRAFLSGSFEDAYRQTAKHLVQNDEDQQRALTALIAHYDVSSMNSLHISKGTIGLIATALLLMQLKWMHPLAFPISVTAFAIGILLQFLAVFFSLHWYRWAKDVLKFSRKQEELGSLRGQLLVFLKSPDLFWSLSVGGSIYLFFSVVALGGLSLSRVDAANISLLDPTTVSWLFIFNILAISFVVHWAQWLGNQLLGRNRQTRSTRMNFLNLLWGPVSVSISSLLITLMYVHGDWTILATPVCLLMSLLIGPLRTWQFWMRVPLANQAESHPRNQPYFGQSHVFYYSLLAAGYQLGILFAILLSGTYFTQGDDLNVWNVFLFTVITLAIWKALQSLRRSAIDRK